MYSSSSLTIFFRYYFPFIFLGLVALVYLLTNMQTTELLTIIAVVICGSPIYFLTLGQLRYVKAMHDKLVTETLNYEEEIKYEQINYIYQSALTKPIFVRISYSDSETGKTKRFYAMGSLSEDAFRIDPFQLRELELTKFIRRKIKEANPEYDEDSEPSRWTTPLLTLILILLTIFVGTIIQNITGV